MAALFMCAAAEAQTRKARVALRIDEATAAKLYDSSRPMLTADGTVSGEVERKMTGFVLKTAGAKEPPPPSEKLYDFALVKKAHLALQARGWQPVP